MTPITADDWHTRIPWHVKARAITQLDAAIAAKRAELEHLAGLIERRQELATNAHAAYARGLRDPWVIEGERAYQRARVRKPRTERKTL